MTEFILKIFFKNRDITSPNYREAVGKFAGAVGIICNTLLCALKFVIGYISNSVAITADAVNNLSDAGSSIITLVGFRLSGKPADREHPFGHARYEYIAGLIVSFLIMIIGINIAKSSIIKIIHPEETVFSFAFVIILIVSIIVKLWLSFLNRGLGKAIKSPALAATSTDSRNDCITTFAVLISTFISHFSQYNTDGIFGLLVSIFIIYSGYGLVKETIDPLLGQAPDEEMYELIGQKIQTYENVLGIHDLMIHSYGPGSYFASVHVEVDANSDIMTSHDLLDKIERDFIENYNIHLVAHMDPIVTDNDEVNRLRELVTKTIKDFDSDYSIHDFRVVFGSDYKNILFDVVLPYECKYKDYEISDILKKLIQEKINEKIYVIITVDHSYGL